jgi:hypothetical protein
MVSLISGSEKPSNMAINRQKPVSKASRLTE